MKVRRYRSAKRVAAGALLGAAAVAAVATSIESGGLAIADRPALEVSSFPDEVEDFEGN